MLHRDVAGLHVHEAGEGRPIVLLHAFPVDSELYEDQLAGTFAGWRVIAPDLPGFGKSPLGEVASLDDHARAVLGVLDSERIERCVLGGCSMGGYVAFAMLRKAASRFDGLVLVDTRMGPDNDEGRRGREETARRALEEGTAGLIEEMLPRLLGPRTLSARPEVVSRVRKMSERATKEGAAAALRAMAARPDSRATLEAFARPALVVVGAEDPITGPAEAEAMCSVLQSSSLRIVEGAGHLPSIETPAELNAALAEFLSAL